MYPKLLRPQNPVYCVQPGNSLARKRICLQTTYGGLNSAVVAASRVYFQFLFRSLSQRFCFKISVKNVFSFLFFSPSSFVMPRTFPFSGAGGDDAESTRLQEEPGKLWMSPSGRDPTRITAIFKLQLTAEYAVPQWPLVDRGQDTYRRSEITTLKPQKWKKETKAQNKKKDGNEEKRKDGTC